MKESVNNENKNDVMRVLNIMGSLDRGGQETTIMHHYRNLDRNLVQFDFLLTDQSAAYGNFEAEAIAMGARIFKRPLRSKKPYQNAKALKHLLQTHPEIQAVHIHNYSPLIGIDTWIAQRCGIPMRIAHSRCEMIPMPLYQRIFRPLLRSTATHWLACSEQAGISLYGEKAKDDPRFQILPNARPLDDFYFNDAVRNKQRLAMNVANDVFVWINVGRLVEQKNQGFLLKTFAQALQYNPRQILWIAGAGPNEKQLMDQARALNISDKVFFLGLRKDIAQLLQAADGFVLPSLFEGLPGTAIEAQAAGLPCLLADTIAKETKITDLVEFLPIDQGIEIWSKHMCDFSIENIHEDTSEAMIQAGYNINTAATNLMNLYLHNN